MRIYGYTGLLLIALAGFSMVFDLRPITTWVTPIAWTGYILLVDSIIFKLKGNSLIATRTREFLVMLPLSIGFWLIFEWYNLFIRNWHYIGLPDELWVRWIGYGWSFATIMPAIFETTELVAGLNIFGKAFKKVLITKGSLYSLMTTGICFLALPLVVPLRYARYMAALVWAGFIFLLDPLNYMLAPKETRGLSELGGNSILRDWEDGKFNRFLSLLLGGLICGALWEFWNFWAYTKWIYTVPILGDIKVFEMPVIGYLGFPPFAVELYAMYSSVNILRERIKMPFPEVAKG